jgi:hypothetical protein
MAAMQKLYEMNNGPGIRRGFSIGGKTVFFWFMLRPIFIFSAAAAAFEWIGGKILDKWGK